MRSARPGEALLHEASFLASAAARAKGIAVRVVPTGPLPAANADRHRLRQVLSNLCDNAIKFTPAGGVVRLSAGAADYFACISVTDSGPGLPDAQSRRAFERSWQADQERASRGVGLGLAIARWIVELHGGAIGAGNAPGGGLRVAFTIPLYGPAVSGAAAVSRSDAA